MEFSHFFRKTLNSMLNSLRHPEHGGSHPCHGRYVGSNRPRPGLFTGKVEGQRVTKATARESNENIVRGAAVERRGDASSLFSLYARWFDVVPADTQARLEEAYRLRYQ